MTTQTPQVGKPEKRGVNRWFVPSGNMGVGYTVERLDGRWRCTCPSFRWGKTGTCKHVQAIIKNLRGEIER